MQAGNAVPVILIFSIIQIIDSSFFATDPPERLPAHYCTKIGLKAFPQSDSIFYYKEKNRPV